MITLMPHIVKLVYKEIRMRTRKNVKIRPLSIRNPFNQGSATNNVVNTEATRDFSAFPSSVPAKDVVTTKARESAESGKVLSVYWHGMATS